MPAVIFSASAVTAGLSCYHGYFLHIQTTGLMHKYTIATLALLIFISTAAFADNKALWGHGKLTPTGYKPQKVVYDVTTGKPEIMDHVLDRAGYLGTITGADPFDQSIVLVLYDSAIRFFAIENTGKYRNMLTPAESLVSSEVLKTENVQTRRRSTGLQA
jgi:hypothetical protein